MSASTVQFSFRDKEDYAYVKYNGKFDLKDGKIYGGTISSFERQWSGRYKARVLIDGFNDDLKSGMVALWALTIPAAVRTALMGAKEENYSRLIQLKEGEDFVFSTPYDDTVASALVPLGTGPEPRAAAGQPVVSNLLSPRSALPAKPPAAARDARAVISPASGPSRPAPASTRATAATTQNSGRQVTSLTGAKPLTTPQSRSSAAAASVHQRSAPSKASPAVVGSGRSVSAPAAVTRSPFAAKPSPPLNPKSAAPHSSRPSQASTPAKDSVTGSLIQGFWEQDTIGDSTVSPPKEGGGFFYREGKKESDLNYRFQGFTIYRDLDGNKVYSPSADKYIGAVALLPGVTTFGKTGSFLQDSVNPLKYKYYSDVLGGEQFAAAVLPSPIW